jgi:hypothetical protein
MTVVENNAAKRDRRTWVILGAGLSILIVGFFAALTYFIIEAFKSSEAFKMGVSRLVESSEATRALGAPITPGIPWGTIKISGPDGYARMQFSATGPNADGTVYVAATKQFGTWRIDREELEVKGHEGRIVLSP